MTNPMSSTQMSRLKSAVDTSDKKLQVYRKNRRDILKEFIGSHYSSARTDESGDKVPVNFLELAVQIYTYALSAGMPKALVTSPARALRARAGDVGLAIDHLATEIEFGETAQELVKDGLFGMAIAKCALEAVHTTDVNGYTHDSAQPFCDRVSLDDFVFDMSASRWDKIAFCGDEYDMSYDYVMQAKNMYVNTKDLQPKAKNDAPLGETERAKELSRGEESLTDEEFRDQITLRDLWLPEENLVLTIPAGRQEPIRVVEWEGPEWGPYHRLSFESVPDQIMPLAPSALWLDLHTLANDLFKKISRRALGMKTILGYQGNADDAQRIVSAEDLEAIRLDNPAGAKDYQFGGIDAASVAFLVHVRDLFNWLGGNLNAIGGLAAMSETVGQDEMMERNSSRRIQDMAMKTRAFVRKIMRSLAWYLWYDPDVNLSLLKRVPGTEIDVQTRFSAADREGDFLDYNIDIQPYSMQEDTPGSKVAKLTQVWQTFVIPLAQLMPSQGVVPNFEGLFRLLAKYANLPELEDTLTYTAPMMPETGIRGPGKPPITRRENVRINRSAGTQPGRDAALMQTLLGAGVQNSEMAGTARQ